jgi:Concanavalin A-like lectin/glucanases superfamily
MSKRFYEKHLPVSQLKRNYSLLIFFVILAATSAFAASTLPIPPNSSFTPPSPNACQSNYDQFYIAEPGVYAYWSLCEPGSNPAIFDYAGRFDLTPASSAWSSGPGTIQGGVPGPVPDGETADQVATASSFVASEDIPMNTNQGTVALWANTDSTGSPTPMIYLEPVFGHGRSSLSVQTLTPSKSECFMAVFGNSSGSSFSTPLTSAACGYSEDTWHRVVLTWLSGTMKLYVDGTFVSSAAYSGLLDNTIFVYRLFPETVDNGKQMSLAKVSLSNQAWSAAQATADYHPSFAVPPAGGVYVTSQPLGVIHRDVLGYADTDADLSTAPLVSALTTGLATMGAKAVRYANGSSGSSADLDNWNGGPSCTATRGSTSPAPNVHTQNTLDNYYSKISRPLGITLGYTVNYGTNPPVCNAGGGPSSNGANLLAAANTKKGFGIKYWEIGNELFGGGTFETDFHPSPGLGASYASYETAFYSRMKSQDSTISIGIPVADGVYSWLVDWTLPAMQSATYDAVVYHNYPLRDPITDGQSLYPERRASNVGRTRGGLLALQTELLNVNKSPGAIWITEWNANANGDQWSLQTMGAVMPIVATTMLAEYMQAGVQYATWYGQGMSNDCSLFNYDQNGDSAYNWWHCGGSFLTYTGPLGSETVVGLKAGDITPTARAFQILSESGFVTEGEHMLRVFTDLQNAPWLSAYAATHGTSYEVILINRDRDNAHTVPIQLAGQTGGQLVQQWTYGRAQYDQTRTGNWSVAPVTSKPNSGLNGVLPPWSVNVFLIN